MFNRLTKTDQKPILALAIASYQKGLNVRLSKPVAPAFVCFSAILRVQCTRTIHGEKVKQSGSAIAQSPAALKAGAALNKVTEMSETEKQKSNKKAQVLVLDSLNDLFNEASTDNDARRPISLGAVIIYSDGTASSQMAGDLNRILLTGALHDLVNQIFFECKQREINNEIEKSIEAMHLATVQAQDGSKPN